MASGPGRPGAFREVMASLNQRLSAQAPSSGNGGDTDMTAPEPPVSRTKRPRDMDHDSDQATSLSNEADTHTTVPDHQSVKRTKDDSYQEQTGDEPKNWESMFWEMKYKFDECAHHYRELEKAHKREQQHVQNITRETLALKDQVKKLTRPESDVIYDLREEFKKVEEKKDQKLTAAERRYETCHAEKEQLKADAAHVANSNSESEWKKTAMAKQRDLIEVEKQLHVCRACNTGLQTTVKEGEKQVNALQMELETIIDKGRTLEQTHNETVSQMFDLQQTHNETVSEMSDLQQKHEGTLVKARGLENKCEFLNNENIRIQDDYDELYGENYALQQTYESLLEDKENLEHKSKMLESELGQSRDDREQLVSVKKARTRAQNQLESLGTEFTEIKAELATAHHTIQELEKRPTETQFIESQSIVDVLQKELENRPTEAQAVKAERMYQELQSRCSELEKVPPVDAETAEGRKIIQDLRNRCDQLEKRPTEIQVAEGQKTFQDLRSQCEELEKRSESQVAEARSIIQELRNRCSELEKRPTEIQIAEVQNTLQALQRRCDELETQSTEAQGDLSSTQAAMIILQDRCNELELRPTDAELLGLQATLTILQDRCNELELRPTEVELLGTQSALTKLQHQFNEPEKGPVEADAQDRSKKQNIQPSEAEGELINLRQTLQTVQGTLSDLTKESLKKQSALEADLVAARSALTDSETREKKADELQSATDVELLDAQLELTEQHQQIQELEKKLQEKSAPETKSEFEEKVKKLEEQLQQHSAQESTLTAVRIDLANLQTRFKKLEKEHEETDQVNRQLKNSSKTLQDDLVARDFEVQELHSKNKTHRDQLAKAEKDLKTIQQKATVDESHIKSQDEAMSGLSGEISQLKGRCENLDRVAKNSKKQSSESETALSLLKTEHEALEKVKEKIQNDSLEAKSLLRKKKRECKELEKEHNDLKEGHEKLKKEKAEGDSLSEKVGAEYKRLDADHRRVCNSLKTLQIAHAKCSTGIPSRSEQSIHTPISDEPSRPSAEDTKDLAPHKIEGEKQLDDGESFGDNASRAMDETPLDDQLRRASPGIAPGKFGGGSVSEDAVSQNEGWPDHTPGENGGTAAPGPKGGDNLSATATGGTAAPGPMDGDNPNATAIGGTAAPGPMGGDGPSATAIGGTAAPGPMGGDGPSATANGGAAAPAPKGGDNRKAPAAPASGGGNRPLKTPPAPGTGRPTPQKLQAPSFFPTASSSLAFLLILIIACISFYFVSDHYSRVAYDAVLTRADDTTRAMLLSERMGGGTGTMWPAWLGQIMDDNIVEMIPGLYG